MLNPHSVALTAIAAALALPLSMGSAQAAVVATFDPAFNGTANVGGSTANLGFKGYITLDPSTNCSNYAGRYIYTGVDYGYGSCDIPVIAPGAHIDFYNAYADPGATNILTSIDLDAATYFANYVSAAYFDNTGMLAGFDSYVSSGFQVTVTDGNPTYPISYNFPAVTDTLYLYFESGQPGYPDTPPFEGCGEDCGARQGASVDDPARLINRDGDGNQTTSQPARVTFSLAPTAIPEPDSVALAALGVAALVANRRRRKRKVATS